MKLLKYNLLVLQALLNHTRLDYNFYFIFNSRDERRWIDKQNKAARQKLKKEEVMRLRNIVGKCIFNFKNFISNSDIKKRILQGKLFCYVKRNIFLTHWFHMPKEEDLTET